MGQERFGRVLLDRRGTTGLVTVRGWPAPTILAPALLGLAAVINVAYMLILALEPEGWHPHFLIAMVCAGSGVAAFIFCTVFYGEPWLREMRKLEVYEKPGESSGDYRKASTGGTPAPARGAPGRSAERRAQRHAQHERSGETTTARKWIARRCSWCFRAACSASPTSTTTSEAVSACAEALASLLGGVPVREASDAASSTSIAMLLGAGLSVIYLVLAVTPDVMDKASLLVREGSLVAGLVLMLVVCLVVVPFFGRRVDRSGAVKFFDMAE